MKGAGRSVGIAIAALAFAIPAGAESIQITSGALHGTGLTAPSPVRLVGEGFVFDGVGLNGIFGPFLGCQQCMPGTAVDLFARWVGSDLPGTATVNGTTFTGVGGLLSDTSLDAIWTGSLIIPEDFSGGVLSVPFGFTGGFFIPGGKIDLSGAGTTSLTFVPYPDVAGAFRLTSAAYEFNGESAVAEPMSLILVGTGLAGLAALRRRHNMRR